jgi:two-component system response regulator YesN
MKIVVVEDEIIIREGIVSLLKKFYPCNTEIFEANCGKDGLAVIRNVRPNIVITDIRMEPVSGLEMLNILAAQDHLAFKTLILSAYSEFDYAKQAISLGVYEYIVKPVDVGEFQLIMSRLENEIIRESLIKYGNSSIFDSLENVLSGILSKQIDFNHDVSKYVEDKYAIMPNRIILTLYVYCGKVGKERYNLLLQKVKMLLRHDHNGTSCIIAISEENALLCVFFNNQDIGQLERCIKETIMKTVNKSISGSAVFVIDWFKGIENIGDSFKNLKKYLQWNISLGNECLISVKELEEKKCLSAPYPIKIERDSIARLCSDDNNGLREQGMLFIRYFSGNCYSPDSIKKCCIRYFMALLQVIKELNYNAYATISEQEILDEIKSANVAGELENALSRLFDASLNTINAINASSIVKKVIRIVEEYYKNGITLKEVANELGLSPDYISVQFISDLGVNFSTYIKNFRLSEAKKLLIGTELKIFEIAHRTGYTDAKYFSRVFTEAEGVHPLDYRKKYR